MVNRQVNPDLLNDSILFLAVKVQIKVLIKSNHLFYNETLSNLGLYVLYIATSGSCLLNVAYVLSCIRTRDIL